MSLFLKVTLLLAAVSLIGLVFVFALSSFLADLGRAALDDGGGVLGTPPCSAILYNPRYRSAFSLHCRTIAGSMLIWPKLGSVGRRHMERNSRPKMGVRAYRML